VIRLVLMYRCRFVFDMCSVRISALAPAFLTKIAVGYPQFLQANVSRVNQFGHNRFYPFQSIIHELYNHSTFPYLD
jgi:hypothetical protein